MKKIIVANFKMYKTHTTAIQWLSTYLNDLTIAAHENQIDLIICPSFTELATFHALLKSSPIQLGAQTCAAKVSGPLNGEVSAISLAEVGCSYTLVGHRDQRVYHGETDESVAQKVKLLIDAGIIPLICIGNVSQDIDTYYLEQQLNPIIGTLQHKAPTVLHIVYEPWWAIGTGITPSADELNAALVTIKNYLAKHLKSTQIVLLYGGSVDQTIIASFRSITELHGYLIGHASTEIDSLLQIINESH